MISFADQIDRLKPGRLTSKAIGLLCLAAAAQFIPVSLSDTPSKKTSDVGMKSPTTSQDQKFSWVMGEDQGPVFETKRLENVHGVRVRTALHTLAAMGPDDPRKNKFMKIMAGGRFAPVYPTVREIAKDLGF